MEDEEALEAGALIGALTEAVEDDVDDLLANCVMTASVVIRRILFPYIFDEKSGKWSS